MINRAYHRAQEVLTEHKPKLVQISEYLIEHEAVSGEELNRLFNMDAPGGDTETPAVPQEPPPYAPKPNQQQPIPQPAPSPSLSSYNEPAPPAG